MKERIMLVNLPVDTFFANSPADASEEHIGLGYIAAYLKDKGMKDVEILDAASRRLPESEIIKRIQEHRPNFICLSPTYLTWHLTVRILNKIKDEDNDIITILGGPHVSFEPVLSRALKEYRCIDIIVRGEGEIATYKIVKWIVKQASLCDLSIIPGVSYRLNGQVIIADDFAESVDSLDSLPFPLRDILPLQGKSLRITTSRGCYKNGSGCTFCPSAVLYPKGWRSRSAKDVVDEIECLNKQGFNSFVSAEADFIGFSRKGLQRSLEIADEILTRRLSIHLRLFAGVRQILQAEKFGVLERLKRIGLERIFTGIESADPNTLDIFGKSQSLSEIYAAVDILRRRKISLQAGFIMFHPWGTFRSIEENCRFLKHIDQVHLWHNLSTTSLLFPGTKLLQRVQSEDLLIEDLSEVGLGEEFAYNYRFIDPQIETVFQSCLALLKNPVIIDMDRMLITATIVLSSFGKHTPAEMGELKQVYVKTKKYLSHLNLETFYRIIELSKAESSERIESTLSNHLDKCYPCYVEMRQFGLEKGGDFARVASDSVMAPGVFPG